MGTIILQAVLEETTRELETEKKFHIQKEVLCDNFVASF